MTSRPTVIVDSVMNAACRQVAECDIAHLGREVRCWVVVPNDPSKSSGLLTLHEPVPQWQDDYCTLVLYDRGEWESIRGGSTKKEAA